MHTLLSALLACFLNEENVHHVQRGKTVSIETEAILSGNHWLLTGKKKHVCSGVELFLVLVSKLLLFIGYFAVI